MHRLSAVSGLRTEWTMWCCVVSGHANWSVKSMVQQNARTQATKLCDEFAGGWLRRCASSFVCVCRFNIATALPERSTSTRKKTSERERERDRKRYAQERTRNARLIQQDFLCGVGLISVRACVCVRWCSLFVFAVCAYVWVMLRWVRVCVRICTLVALCLCIRVRIRLRTMSPTRRVRN